MTSDTGSEPNQFLFIWQGASIFWTHKSFSRSRQNIGINLPNYTASNDQDSDLDIHRSDKSHLTKV